ncbi:MAG: TCR/Tet family MFS transporter [Alphaproteobacteria bacterium]|nr:TCR/Tet family MFS transporter [Alphaproteobacteria bacterium]
MASPSRHALTFIFLTVLIDSIGFGVTLPVFPDLIVTLEGGTLDEATIVGGYLLALFAVMQIVFGPLMGNLSDRFGRRPVLLLSLAAFGIDYALMAFAPNLAWLFVGRAIAGLAGAVYVPANAFIADVTEPDKRAQAYGLIGGAFGAGFILGPALGGLLGELGPRAPFFAAAGLALLNVLYGFFVLPESLPPEKRRAFEWRRANPLGAFRALTRMPALGLLAAALFAWALAGTVYPATWAFFAKIRFAWSAADIGLSLAFVGMTMTIVQVFVTGPAVKRLGERRALVTGIAFGIFEFVAMAVITEGWMIYPVMAGGALSGLAYPALNALLSQQTAASEQGELQGALSGLNALSEIAGPLLMTGALGYFSGVHAPVHFPGAAFALAAGLALVALGFLALAGRRREAAA